MKKRESPEIVKAIGELNACLEESNELTEIEQPEPLNKLLVTIDLKAMQREIEEGLKEDRSQYEKLVRIRKLNTK